MILAHDENGKSLQLNQPQFSSASLYVQYGCAYNAPVQWLNFDSSLTLRAERLPLIGRFIQKNDIRFPSNARYGDIVRGLPVAAGSCDGIYACHVLEHMTLNEAEKALRNTFQLLKPGGVFRVVVPDLRVAASRYLKNNDRQAANFFLRSILMGSEKSSQGVMDRLTRAFGRSAHLWMWDFASLSLELEKVGFSNVRECQFNDSTDPIFRFVEDSSRFLDAVAIECIK